MMLACFGVSVILFLLGATTASASLAALPESGPHVWRSEIAAADSWMTAMNQAVSFLSKGVPANNWYVISLLLLLLLFFFF